VLNDMRIFGYASNTLFVTIPDSNHLYGPIPTELGLLSTLKTLNLGRGLANDLALNPLFFRFSILSFLDE
jgi:hypothetical protein